MRLSAATLLLLALTGVTFPTFIDVYGHAQARWCASLRGVATDTPRSIHNKCGGKDGSSSSQPPSTAKSGVPQIAVTWDASSCICGWNAVAQMPWPGMIVQAGKGSCNKLAQALPPGCDGAAKVTTEHSLCHDAVPGTLLQKQ
jgi:hypothetical protein